MPFVLLFFLMLVCLPEEWRAPLWATRPEQCLLAAVGAMTALAALATLSSAHLCWRLRMHPEERSLVLRRYQAVRFLHLLGLCTSFAVVLYFGGWGWAVGQIFTIGGTQAAGAEFVLLAPFVLTLVVSWGCFYDVEKALNDAISAPEAPSFWSRAAFLAFHIRHHLGLMCVPLLLMIGAKALHLHFPELQRDWPKLTAGIGYGVLGLVFVVMPWILRLVFGLRPLPEGRLRERLLAAQQRLKFRCSNIMLWNTRNGVANAMVVGILPRVRYVLFTDRLLGQLTEDEVEAVFGHEVGHVKHHHMVYYLGFLMISLIVVAGVWDAALSLPQLHDWLAGQKDLEVLPFVALFGCYIFVVFGFLSRRCERQADIYGCKAVSCDRVDCLMHDGATERVPRGQGLCPTGIRIFIEALEKVAWLNGISRERPGWLQSWQHSTIARRVEFLQHMLADPAAEPRFQRRVRFVKWALLIALALALVGLGRIQGWDAILPAI